MPRDLTQRTSLLRIVPQRDGQTDCAIAALASYLCITYEAALLAVGRVSKRDPLSAGTHHTELLKAARRLGYHLRVVPWDRVDQDDATGILHVHGRFIEEKYEDHLVIFRRGDVIDCRDGTVWDADVYLKHFAGTAVSLTVEA
jgi:hypothetical protein